MTEINEDKRDYKKELAELQHKVLSILEKIVIAIISFVLGAFFG